MRQFKLTQEERRCERTNAKEAPLNGELDLEMKIEQQQEEQSKIRHRRITSDASTCMTKIQIIYFLYRNTHFVITELTSGIIL